MGIDHSNPYIHSTTVLCDIRFSGMRCVQNCMYTILSVSVMTCTTCTTVPDLGNQGTPWGKGPSAVDLHCNRNEDTRSCIPAHNNNTIIRIRKIFKQPKFEKVEYSYLLAITRYF